MLLKILLFVVFLCHVFSFASFAREAKKIDVLVSIAPFHSIISRVMQNVAEPELLLDSSVSLHGYRLKPSDMHRLVKSDILFWGGAELESFLQKAVEMTDFKGKNVAFLSYPELKARLLSGKVDKKRKDPHFWLDPENMIVVAKIAARELSVLDPEHKEIYDKNAQSVEKEMKELKQRGIVSLRPYANEPYVVFHDAYRYFENSFGLEPVGFLSIDPHHVSGAGHLLALRKKMERVGALCLFSEPQFSDKSLKVLAEGLETVPATLDPLGIGLSPGVSFYPDLMNALYQSFSECFFKLSKIKGEQK